MPGTGTRYMRGRRRACYHLELQFGSIDVRTLGSNPETPTPRSQLQKILAPSILIQLQ